jgi:hypothetical protein
MRMIASIASLTDNFWERIKTRDGFEQLLTSDIEVDSFVYRTFASSQILLHLL